MTHNAENDARLYTREDMARAWDEGHGAGWDDANDAYHPQAMGTPNPYVLPPGWNPIPPEGGYTKGDF